MPTQAMKVTFITPTRVKPAQVVVTTNSLQSTYAFNANLSNEENAKAAIRSFMFDHAWDGEFCIGEMGSGVFVGVFIEERYIKARDAVIAVRKAMSQGNLHGNPHAKEWGQAITELTDGTQKGGFSREYARSI